MANKKRSKNLKTSLKTIRQINWFDGIHKLPIDVNKNLLDQCSDIIQEFIDGDESLPTKVTKSKSQKRQVSKIKKSKPKATNSKRPKSNKIKSKAKSLKKNTQPFNYATISSTNGYPCYPSAFPCFRSCGPINCPKTKLPMPRDLWYRIVYSQALEQQLGSGEASVPHNRSVSRFRSSSKRKHKDDDSLTDTSSYNNSRRQQTMNAAFSSTSTKDDHLQKKEWHQETLQSGNTNSIYVPQTIDFHIVPSNAYKSFPVNDLEYIAETLPLESEYQQSHSSILKGLIHSKIESKDNHETTLWNTNPDKVILFTQSAHAQLINRPTMIIQNNETMTEIHRGISADATLERVRAIPSIPSAPMINTFKIPLASSVQLEQSNDKITDDNSSIEHSLMNQLIEHYNLQDIPRVDLFKRLNRRLTHVHQTLEKMSSNDIEIKLKYKRDALVKKQQTPVQSLTKDERIAMAELELNVYEYVKVLDEPCRVNNNNGLEVEQLPAPAPILTSNDTVLPVVKSTLTYESSITPSMSTCNTVQPSAISQSTALLSTTTEFSEKTEKFVSWNHPLLPNLINMFEPLTPLRKAQIHKQLARRYEHICKKAKELNQTQLQTQINSKSKALEQNKNILQPNDDELLRIAELELCLFELEKEQTQRNQSN